MEACRQFIRDEMSEYLQVPPLIGGRSQEIKNMDIVDANLVWYIQLGGTCCFLVGAVCLLVAHILGRL